MSNKFFEFFRRIFAYEKKPVVVIVVRGERKVNIFADTTPTCLAGRPEVAVTAAAV